MTPRPRVVAFDIIGTVFSLEPLRDELIALGFPSRTLELLFAETLRDAFSLAATGKFAPFRSLFASTLDNLSRREKVTINSEQQEGILGRFTSLPAHPDALTAFQMTAGEGIRIVALSNGAAASTESLLKRAGLREFVEKVISVDEIKSFKPRRDIYLHAAKVAGVEPIELMLVSTHAWDVHGAKSAGLMAGFVSRGQAFPSAMLSPDIQGESLVDAARAMIG